MCKVERKFKHLMIINKLSNTQTELTSIISVDEDIEKIELSDIADGSVKWYGCFGKQSGSSTKKYA